MSDVKDLIIAKPRKCESTYTCQIYDSEKPNKFVQDFRSAVVLSTKPLQNRNEFLLYLKCKKANDFICDLNAQILQVVKENSPVWFNNNMNTDLVDDYYTNTLIYDKKHGDIIKLKIVGDETAVAKFIMKKSDIAISFDNLRFYKQKFVLECSIDSIEFDSALFVNDALDESEDEKEEEEEEEPGPNGDDISEIKKESLGKAERCIEHLKSKIEEILDLQSQMKKLTHFGSIVKICQELDSCVGEFDLTYSV
jgi:hypothetical protein